MRRFILLVVATLVASTAYAGGDDLEANAKSVLNSGDTNLVNTPSHSSRAFSVSGSDMDIRDGYRSYSVLFGLWQDTKVNPLSLARQLAAEGNYEAAAMIRCSVKTVSKALGGKQPCIEALSKPPPAPPPPPPEVSEVNEDDEDEAEFQVEQLQLYADLQAKVDNLEAELSKPPPPPTRVVERQVVEQAPLLTKEQASSLRIDK